MTYSAGWYVDHDQGTVRLVHWRPLAHNPGGPLVEAIRDHELLPRAQLYPDEASARRALRRGAEVEQE